METKILVTTHLGSWTIKAVIIILCYNLKIIHSMQNMSLFPDTNKQFLSPLPEWLLLCSLEDEAAPNFVADMDITFLGG